MLANFIHLFALLLWGGAGLAWLAGIVACQIGNAFVCRSDRQSVWHIGFTSNRGLLAGIGVEV